MKTWNRKAERTLSLWAGTADVPGRPSLAGDLATDVCIVGAGIAGLTTAYLLAREGRPVVVLDDGPIGGGETGRTTAHLASALDDRFYRLEHLHGESGARLAAESHAAAIDRIEAIVGARAASPATSRASTATCSSRPESPADELDRELEAARRAGLEVEKVARAPLGSFDTGPALRFARQAQFHPLLLPRRPGQGRAGRGRPDLLRRARRAVRGRRPRAREDGDRPQGRRPRRSSSPPTRPSTTALVIHTKQAPYRTYVVGLEVPAGSVDARALLGHRRPLPLRPPAVAGRAAGPDVLIVGGRGPSHRPGRRHRGALDAPRALDARAVPDGAGGRRYRWSGQVLEPADGLAFIGRNPMDEDNVLIATGDSGHGHDARHHRRHPAHRPPAGAREPWAELYDPGAHATCARPRSTRRSWRSRRRALRATG